jgi:hypothetical protein
MNVFSNILGSPRTSAAAVGTVGAAAIIKVIAGAVGIDIPTEVITGAVSVMEFVILLLVKGAPVKAE